jgi:hypothetical protein
MERVILDKTSKRDFVIVVPHVVVVVSKQTQMKHSNDIDIDDDETMRRNPKMAGTRSTAAEIKPPLEYCLKFVQEDTRKENPNPSKGLVSKGSHTLPMNV